MLLLCRWEKGAAFSQSHIEMRILFSSGFGTGFCRRPVFFFLFISRQAIPADWSLGPLIRLYFGAKHVKQSSSSYNSNRFFSVTLCIRWRQVLPGAGAAGSPGCLGIINAKNIWVSRAPNNKAAHVSTVRHSACLAPSGFFSLLYSHRSLFREGVLSPQQPKIQGPWFPARRAVPSRKERCVVDATTPTGGSIYRGMTA